MAFVQLNYLNQRPLAFLAGAEGKVAQDHGHPVRWPWLFLGVLLGKDRVEAQAHVAARHDLIRDPL
ncbi:MAG: hypothetical protein R3204_13910, partial [Oceanospirillum sp.]|nr:hypothetical protein [Oceanospirillum sp.]